MSTQSFDEEIQDNDPTDELPILTDVILGEDGAYTAAAPEPQAEADDSAAVRLQKDLDARDERLSTLESELTRLQERWSDTESALSERDDELSRLRDELSDRETAMEKQRAALDESANELQSQKTTIAELTSALELERERSAGLERSANELQQKISGLEDKIESIEAESEVARETSKQDGVDQPATRLREEVAALSQHIENRNAVWREQTDTLAAQSTRIRELEIELAQRLERQLEAERLAQRASADAHAAREQLGAALEKLRRSKPAEKRLAAPEAPRREEVSDEAISDDDHAAQLRRELAQTVLLQANQGDDAETLKRLAELEAAIMSLESQMDSPRDSAGASRARYTVAQYSGYANRQGIASRSEE